MVSINIVSALTTVYCKTVSLIEKIPLDIYQEVSQPQLCFMFSTMLQILSC